MATVGVTIKMQIAIRPRVTVVTTELAHPGSLRVQLPEQPLWACRPASHLSAHLSRMIPRRCALCRAVSIGPAQQRMTECSLSVSRC